MSNKRIVLLVLIAVWVALVAASYFMSVRIEGPRNIDTGFRRLDVMFRYQVTAFGVAVIALVLGMAWRKSGRRMLLLGATPLLASLSLVAALFVAVKLYGSGPTPASDRTPKVTAPAETAVPVED